MIFVYYYAVLAATPAPIIQSISGLGGTWSEIGHVASPNNTRTTSLWVGSGCSGTGQITVVTDQSGVNSNQGYVIFEWPGSGGVLGTPSLLGHGSISVTGTTVALPSVSPSYPAGVDTTTPAIASNTKSSSFNSTSGTVTPNALAKSGNAYIVGNSHGTAENVSPTNGSAVELVDDNATDNRGMEVNYLVGYTSGNMGTSWTTSGQGSLQGAEINAVAGAVPTLDRKLFKPIPFTGRGKRLNSPI